jgi:two-component system, LytTR family, response regulator
MKIKTIIVDDNPEHLNQIENLIEDNKDIQLIRTFTNPILALHFLKENKIDLIFSDIEMKGMSGLDLINSLSNPPLIVFVSSFPAYAIDSFKFEALHFIKKPISERELYTAIDRAKNRMRNISKSEDYIIIKKGHSDFVKIIYNNILFIEADNDYVQIITKDKTIRTHCTLKKILKELPKNFIKTHRSYIINKKYASTLSSSSIRISEYTIPISRAYKSDMKKQLFK